jgi:hypothetical protein
MNRYLFGLGAMAVGAGLMFVLTHGEVEAIGKKTPSAPFICSKESILNKYFDSKGGKLSDPKAEGPLVWHCRAGRITCGVTGRGDISCVEI